MDALKVDESEQLQAKEEIELIDCGRASERTKGEFLGMNFEPIYPPFSRFGS